MDPLLFTLKWSIPGAVFLWEQGDCNSISTSRKPCGLISWLSRHDLICLFSFLKDRLSFNSVWPQTPCIAEDDNRLLILFLWLQATMPGVFGARYGTKALVLARQAFCQLSLHYFSCVRFFLNIILCLGFSVLGMKQEICAIVALAEFIRSIWPDAAHRFDFCADITVLLPCWPVLAVEEFRCNCWLGKAAISRHGFEILRCHFHRAGPLLVTGLTVVLVACVSPPDCST